MCFAKNFFTLSEQEKIIQTIKDAEQNTSAEIKVHIENFCIGDPIKRAQKVFLKHQMHKTKYRNGVLFYIAVWNKKIAVIGDKGIHEKVQQQFWETLINELIQAFKADKNKAHILCQCILKVGDALSKYFPADNDNPNELSNEISYN